MKPPPALRALDQIAVVFALFAGVAVAILSLLIVFDIAARSLFRFSLQGTDELGGYTLALTGSLGLAYTLIRRGHPRIDIGFRFFGRARAGSCMCWRWPP
jgi:TRAP-type C4-dicarboxylate transport system permease small subunit